MAKETCEAEKGQEEDNEAKENNILSDKISKVRNEISCEIVIQGLVDNKNCHL